MSDREAMSQVLLRRLAGIDFAKRYYRYYEKCRDRTSACGTREDFERAVKQSGMSFRYNKRERFFSYKEKHPGCEIVFKIAYLYSQFEYILFVNTQYGYVGGPFAVLARDSEELKDPSFKYSPACPTIPFATIEEAREIVSWGVGVYDELREVIRSYEGWYGNMES